MATKKITLNELRSLVKRIVLEKIDLNTTNDKIEEYFGGSGLDGEVNIKIDGDDDEAKEIIVNIIKDSLKHIGGSFNLYLDGNKIYNTDNN